MSNIIGKAVGKIGFIVKPITKVATNPKAMMVVDVLWYSSSLVKAVCEIARDTNRDYETRKQAEGIIEKVAREELKGYLTDNREELLADILTDKEKAFIKSVSEKAKKAS